MNRKQNLEKRNERMYKEFEHLFNEKGLRYDVAYTRLAEKYFLQPDHVRKIINRQAERIRDARRCPTLQSADHEQLK